MCCQIQNADVCFHFKIPTSLAEKRDSVELGNTIRLQLIEKISLFLQTCKYRPVKRSLHWLLVAMAPHYIHFMIKRVVW